MPKKGYKSITINEKIHKKLRKYWDKEKSHKEGFSIFIERKLLENEKDHKDLQNFAKKIKKWPEYL